jgi:hypothetical protein
LSSAAVFSQATAAAAITTAAMAVILISEIQRPYSRKAARVERPD